MKKNIMQVVRALFCLLCLPGAVTVAIAADPEAGVTPFHSARSIAT